jgi:hypothetical protein
MQNLGAAKRSKTADEEEAFFTRSLDELRRTLSSAQTSDVITGISRTGISWMY